jgi:hypothetical protein
MNILNLFRNIFWFPTDKVNQTKVLSRTKHCAVMEMGYRPSASRFFIHTGGGAQETLKMNIHFLEPTMT